MPMPWPESTAPSLGYKRSSSCEKKVCLHELRVISSCGDDVVKKKVCLDDLRVISSCGDDVVYSFVDKNICVSD